MPRYFGNELFIVVAAVFGALTAALLSGNIPWQQKAVILMSGAGFAIFAVPALCEYYAITSPYAIGAVLYFGGILGNLFLIKILTWMQKVDVVGMVLDAYRGKGKPPSE